MSKKSSRAAPSKQAPSGVEQAEIAPPSPAMSSIHDNDDIDLFAAHAELADANRREVAQMSRDRLSRASDGLAYDDGSAWDPTADRWLEAVGERTWAMTLRAAAPPAPEGRTVAPPGVHPLGLFAAVLARVGCWCPPRRALPMRDFPNRIGGTLGLYLILVAPKGSAKSTLNATAEQLVAFPSEGGVMQAWDDTDVRSPCEFTAPVSGSGVIRHLTVANRAAGVNAKKLEEIRELHTRADAEPDVFMRTAALFTADEGEALERWASKAVDLASVARTAWTGGRLGVPASEAARRIEPIPGGGYTVAMIALQQTDVSSGSGHDLYGDDAAARGTLDRFLFATSVPPAEPFPPMPAPAGEYLIAPQQPMTRPGVTTPMPVEASISDDMALRASGRDLPDWWPEADHGTHTDLLRLKVAACIACAAVAGADPQGMTAGTPMADKAAAAGGVTRAHWDAAGVMLRFSKRVRLILASTSELAQMRTRSDATRRQITDNARRTEARTEDLLDFKRMIAARVARAVAKADKPLAAHKALRESMASRDRARVQATWPALAEGLGGDILDIAVEEGWVESKTVKRDDVAVLMLSPGEFEPPEARTAARAAR